MPDNQSTDNVLDAPTPGAPLTPGVDASPSPFNRKLSDVEFRQVLDEAKPKTTGEKLSVGVAKYMLDNKKNYEGVKDSNKQVSNRMIAQRSDVLNDINTQKTDPPENDQAAKDLKKQQAEFEKELFSKYDIPAEERHEGRIIPVPKGFKSDYLEKLSVKHPAWAKQYLQLRKDPDTGELSWQGYNKPSILEGRDEATVYSTKFSNEGFVEENDPVTGMKVKKPSAEVSKFWEEDANAKDYSTGATRAVGFLRNSEAAGNYRVSKLMASNPKVWANFKKEAESLTGQDMNEEGYMGAAQKAIEKAYSMDQPISSVAPHISEWAITDAINKQNNFVDYTNSYNKQQDNLSAKIRLAGEADIYRQMPDKFDRLHELEGQLARDPQSLTKQDQVEYNQLKLDVTNKTLESMKDSPLSTAFKTNAAEYEKRYKNNVRDVTLLGTEEGQKALTLLAKQSKGYELSRRLSDYFPGVKKADQEQQAKDQQPDKFSVIKSFIRGLRGSTESFRSGAMRVLGFGEEAVGTEISRERAMQPDLRTPNRDEKESVWNKIANFTDKTGEFIGNMAPYIAVTAATGGAGDVSGAGFLLREGAPFFTSGYNDYYREARAQGLDEGDAQLKGILGGAALVLSQKFVPKGQMLDRGLINKEIADVVRAGAIDKSKLVNFFSKFIEGAAHGETAVVANGLADYAMNSYENATKGTHFATDQLEPGKLVEQGLMFGIMASMMNGLARTDNKEAARAAVLKMSETHPLVTLRAIDDAITLSKTDKTYNETSLQRMKKDVSEALQMSFPTEFSMEQRIATFDLVKRKQELISEQATADKEFKDAYDNKIKYIDQQLRDISDKQEAAQKHLDKISDPLYKQMEAEGYFDVPKKEKAKAEVVKGEGPVLIRHGETEANRLGVTGSEDDPLNAHGQQQAQELASNLEANGIKHVITAPSVRAKETADIVAKKTGGDVIVNDNLREWQTGADKTPIASFDEKHYVNHPEEKPAGGESFNSFLSRVQGVRDQMSGVNKETAVITHGKVLKLMDALDKTGGLWDEKAKAEYLKDKDFENATAYKEGKKLTQPETTPKEEVKAEISHDQKIEDRYGRKPEEIIKRMKNEGLLKVICPPAKKTKVSLRNMKRA